MKWTPIILLFALLSSYSSKVSAQNIIVDDTYSAQQLVENILVNSTCANVSNSFVSGDNFTSGQNSYGYFNAGTSSFPFSEGIVLSTWSSKKSVGPYVANIAAADSNLWLGDSDLDTVLGKSTLNATILEFDFTPLTNFLSFDYIFASNEYQSFFPCTYSDAFAFLIKEAGSTAPYQNLAVLPNSTTPVSSTNVHPLIPAIVPTPPLGINGCPAINEAYFGAFNTSASPINYAGQTVVLNAQTIVIPNKTYHIKLVIADNQSTTFNSAVFLKAGSFAPKIDFGNDRLLTTNNPVCFGENYIIDTKLSAANSYKWYKNNIEIIGETSPSLSVSDSGIYSVQATLTSSTCVASGKIKVEFTPEIILSNTSLTQCDSNGNGISQFDLTKADNIIRNNDTSLSPVVYYESLSDANGQTNPILNPETYTNKPTVPILHARVSNSYNCVNYAQLHLNIANNTITPQSPFSTCDEDAMQDGLYQFDLNAQVSPQVLSGLPTGMIVSYYLTENDAVTQINPLSNIFKNTLPNQQIIFARIANGPDCYGIIPITLNVNTFNPPNFQDEIAAICSGFSTTLSVPLGFSSYSWSTGEVTNSIIVSNAGNYTVTVTNSNGCAKTKKFMVTSSEIATITGATINDFAGNNNSVVLEYTGSGDYEFSLDGLYYQEKPLFTNFPPGIYSATARDKNGCGTSAPYSVYVLDYPRFFTPNGDNYNDTWRILNLDLFPKATISIFNRYGKLLKELDTTNASWNGTFIGKELAADDYWFRINFGNEKIIKGHFSLKK